MISRVILYILFLVLPAIGLANDAQELSAKQQDYQQWARQTWDSLDKQTGSINLPEANASLNLGEDYYYLSPEDTQTVLVEVWDNPPGQHSLGMILPADSTPFDADSWAVVIQYQEDGYVSDDDAATIDYDALLQEMQEATRADSAERIDQGYAGIELVGWAAAPHYNAETNKLYWAKELAFAQQQTNTLNYNIRVLGRRGVLVLNFIADMDQLPIINDQLDTVLALAEFEQGATYADFDPDIDQVAAYGIGALVAGKVAAKIGLLAMAILFIKKFGVLIIGIAALLRSVFSRKKKSAH